MATTQLTGAALLLTSPYIPLIFMGEEYGETNPFMYFVDHGDSTLIEAVRRGRRREFEGFGWPDRLPDPAAIQTFERSKLDWGKRCREPHARLLALYEDLLALRREEPLLRPDAARLSVEGGDGWIVLVREPRVSSQAALISIYNCSGRQWEVPVAFSHARAWTVRLSTDAARYGGEDRVPHEVLSRPDAGGSKRLTVTMPPWSSALYRQSA